MDVAPEIEVNSGIGIEWVPKPEVGRGIGSGSRN